MHKSVDTLADIHALRETIDARPQDADGASAAGGRLRQGIAGGALALGDAASFAVPAAGLAALGLHGAVVLPAAALMAVATVLLNASAGLYPGRRISGPERLRRRVRTAATVAAVAALSGLLLAGAPALALLFALEAAVALALQPALAGLVRRTLHRAGHWARPAVVIGTGPAREIALARLARDWTLGLVPVPEDTLTAREARKAVAVVADAQAGVERLCALAERYGEVMVLACEPHEAGSRLRASDVDGAAGLVVARRTAASTEAILRRALDLAVALPATLLALPVVACAAAAVWAVDPGSVLYRQPREGRDGREIRVLKIRTMYRDAEARLAALLERDAAAREEWARTYKLRNDPRILPGVGSFLRSSSIDELPQLLNVIAGDMGVVGPRPFPGYHLEAMDAAFREKRRSVTPGLSGLLQVEMRSDADLETQCRFDDWYIDNRSLWLDLDILLRTFGAVIGRGGAY